MATRSWNAGERDRLGSRDLRGPGQAVLFKAGACVARSHALIPRMGLKDQSPAVRGQSGAMLVRFVEHLPASGASAWRHVEPEARTTSGAPPKQRSVKSSTMNGASSPCWSVRSETEPNRSNAVWAGREELLYSTSRNRIHSGGFAKRGGMEIPLTPNWVRTRERESSQRDGSEEGQC